MWKIYCRILPGYDEASLYVITTFIATKKRQLELNKSSSDSKPIADIKFTYDCRNDEKKKQNNDYEPFDGLALCIEENQFSGVFSSFLRHSVEDICVLKDKQNCNVRPGVALCCFHTNNSFFRRSSFNLFVFHSYEVSLLLLFSITVVK